MYAAALTLSAATTAAATGVPYFQLGSIGPIQSFGIIVAAGVLIGAALLRRYAEWHGVSDDHIRGITGWITVAGFLGAHVFDVIAYQWHDFEREPLLMLKVWQGISSYGGFLGGAIGFAIYVWWKRLPARLMADIAIVGLLPAFSIGRIGCTVVSDHIGAAVDPNTWYAALAMDYPRDAIHANSGIAHLFQANPTAGDVIPGWNLGLVEFLYLVPVNLLILWLAFRPAKHPQGDQESWIGRIPSGLVTASTGVLYAPVRFFLDYLRPENSDPRHLGFTFAQWASVAAFGAAAYLAVRLVKSGKPAEAITRTSREAQERLRVILNEDDDERARSTAKGKPEAPAKPKPAPTAKPTPEPSRSDKPDEGSRSDEAEAAAEPVTDDTAAPAGVTPAAAGSVEAASTQDAGGRPDKGSPSRGGGQPKGGPKGGGPHKNKQRKK